MVQWKHKEITFVSVIDKISPDIVKKVELGHFDEISDRIKLRLKHYKKEVDARVALSNLENRLVGMDIRYMPISYGGRVKFLKIPVSSFEQLIRIASFEEIQEIDFFR